MIIALLCITFFLAYANGANDNFKGVATLYGSRTLTYKTALSLATISTLAGSLCSVFLANGLIKSFSGKGLVPTEIIGNPSFLLAVGLGAALTVFLATILGFPISTTHSLIGGLLGAGLMAVGSAVDISHLGQAFVLPLLVSPILAVLFGALIYAFFSRTRKRLGLKKETCICFGNTRQFIPVPVEGKLNRQQDEMNLPGLQVADEAVCQELYTFTVMNISLQSVLNGAHVLSALMVSFARGLNDTPKIAGLMAVAMLMKVEVSLILIALAMALGGLLQARKVADTMSDKITEINHGQGFSTNLVTSLLVLVASKMGVPVSTTHVSVGSIFGIGAVSGSTDKKMVRKILLSWLVTLPVAMIFAALTYVILSGEPPQVN